MDHLGSSPIQRKYRYMIKFLMADISINKKDNGRLEKVSAAQQIEESLISLIIQRTYTNCY